MATLPITQESSVDKKLESFKKLRIKEDLKEALENPLNGPRPCNIEFYRRKEGRAKQSDVIDEQQKSSKKKGGLQRRIRKNLVELYKIAAITHGPFKSKLLIKINNLKMLKKNFKKLDKMKIESIIVENSL